MDRGRYHVVQEFNKGVYDYIIATDESGKGELDEDDREVDEVDEEAEECMFHIRTFFQASTYLLPVLATQRDPMTQEEVDDSPSADPASTSKKRKTPSSPPPPSKKTKLSSSDIPKPAKQPKSKHSKKRKDAEYGVTRGIDFIDVACVLNFDLSPSSRSYTHRVGRTARAGRSGMSLSFIVPSAEFGKNKVVGGVRGTERDEVVWERIEREQGARGSKVKEYKFDMKQVEAFRYRMEDALRAVTRSAVREARVKELKQEILNSDKLKVRTHIRFVNPSISTFSSL